MNDILKVFSSEDEVKQFKADTGIDADIFIKKMSDRMSNIDNHRLKAVKKEDNVFKIEGYNSDTVNSFYVKGKLVKVSNMILNLEDNNVEYDVEVVDNGESLFLITVSVFEDEDESFYNKVKLISEYGE